jgi:hypothetical protein
MNVRETLYVSAWRANGQQGHGLTLKLRFQASAPRDLTYITVT